MSSERKHLTTRLDDLCREITRLIYDNRCCRCGKYIEGSDSHPAHIVAKGNGASKRRFDLMNIILLCLHCHRKWHDSWTEVADWYYKAFASRDSYLDKYRGKVNKISTQEMKDLVEEYKLKLKELLQEK